MTGPEHYRQAEVLIEAARQLGMNSQEMKRTFAEQGVSYDASAAIGSVLAEAQVHATLALAAASASNIRRNGAVENARFEGGNPVAEEWFKAIGGDG